MEKVKIRITKGQKGYFGNIFKQNSIDPIKLGPFSKEEIKTKLDETVKKCNFKVIDTRTGGVPWKSFDWDYEEKETEDVL